MKRAQSEEKDNVINIIDLLAAREIENLLELRIDQATDFVFLLKSGKTLAAALRGIHIASASEISLEVWPKLRNWRDRYFPKNKKAQ